MNPDRRSGKPATNRLSYGAASSARSKAWTVFVLTNAVVVSSNPSRGMDICVRLFCVYVVLSIGRGHATGWFPVQGVLPTVYKI
jgi:hypothetical protein